VAQASSLWSDRQDACPIVRELYVILVQGSCLAAPLVDDDDALVRAGLFHPAGEVLAERFGCEHDFRLGAQVPDLSRDGGFVQGQLSGYPLVIEKCDNLLRHGDFTVHRPPAPRHKSLNSFPFSPH